MVDGWCVGRFEEVGDPKMTDGRQGKTVVEEGATGSRGS